MDDQGRFNIRDDSCGTDGVKVALNEFPESTILRGFSTPNRCNVIAFEGSTKFVDMLSCKASQRNRKIKPHTDGSATSIGEVVHLPIGLFGTFASEDLEVLQSRRIDWKESVSAIHSLGRIHQLFPLDHFGWQEVSKTFESSRFDQGHRKSRRWEVVFTSGNGPAGGKGRGGDYRFAEQIRPSLRAT